jgi:hypothetical protein
MVRITRMTKKRLGELLRDEGLVTDGQVEEALASQRKTGELLGEVLVRLGYVTEYDIAKTIVTQFGLPYLAVKQHFLADDIMRAFPERLMRQYQFIPLDRIGNVITIAVGGLLNFDVLGELEKISGAKIQVFVSTWSEIKAAMEDRVSTDKGKDKDKDKTEGGAAPAGDGSDDELADMELVAGAAEGVDAEEDNAPAATGKSKKDDSLTELGSMLLGDIDNLAEESGKGPG